MYPLSDDDDDGDDDDDDGCGDSDAFDALSSFSCRHLGHAACHHHYLLVLLHHSCI